MKAPDANDIDDGARGGDGKPAQRRPAGPGAVAIATHPTSILVLEDHAQSAAVIRRLLNSQGYVAHCAATCAAAREVWAREHCTVLVADLSLPDGSSLPLMRELHDLGVRGVMLTGYDAPEHRRASRAAGFAAHLIKPVTLAQLLSAVRRAARDLPTAAPDIADIGTDGATDPSLR